MTGKRWGAWTSRGSITVKIASSSVMTGAASEKESRRRRRKRLLRSTVVPGLLLAIVAATRVVAASSTAAVVNRRSNDRATMDEKAGGGIRTFALNDAWKWKGDVSLPQTRRFLNQEEEEEEEGEAENANNQQGADGEMEEQEENQPAEEEEDESQEEVQQDNNADQEQDEDLDEEDAKEEEQHNYAQQTEGGGRGDDEQAFDDYAAARDDDDYQTVRVYDDFYLFQEDPQPISLYPITAREILGYFIASLCLCVCATSGIGGGGIIVPIYVLVTGLPLKIAVPIGAVTVLGGSLGSTLVNLTRRHPLADRPLIDWDLVIVMEPLILVGAIVGVMLHQLMSEKVLVVLLVLLLSITAHITLTKAMRMYQAEKRYLRHLKSVQSEPPAPHGGTSSSSPPPRGPYTWAETAGGTGRSSTTHQEPEHLVVASQDEGDGGGGQESVSTNARMAREERERILIQNPDYVTLRSDLIEEEKFTPRSKIAALVLMFTVLITVNVMVGGGSYGSPWGITCNSWLFWMVHVIMIVFLVISAWVAHTYVVARHEIKELVCFDFTHGDIDWKKAQILYPLTFIGAGFFAGTLGVGGGVITVPLMLHFGLHPAVAAASSSCMIFFTSFASTAIFSVFDLLLPDFGIVGFCVGFFAALTGQSIMRQARQATSVSGRNFERNSYTAFVIGGVILISALLMTIQYVLIIVERPEDYEGGLCEGYRFL